MIARVLHVAACMAVATACASTATLAQGKPVWQQVDLARQLRDTLPQRIRLQYAAGVVDVRAADAPVLYAMHLRYDETRVIPVHRYDAEQRSTVLGIERRGSSTPISGKGDEAGELRLALPRSVPLDLELELGGTQTALELGDMTVQSLRLDCGAADAALSFATPNRTHMRDLEVNVGAAGFSASRLANANADLLRVQGGVGAIDLDFGGTWTRDLSVVARLAIGKLMLRVPPDVGVRLELQRVAAGFEHEGMVKRDDAWYSTNWESAPRKLRIRAETYFGQVDIRRGVR
ncbi:MAG: hypothetical protein JWN53_1233 [Gemmatimonadetes bacterium]|jgi:hypothetical protein|nr:hypothetical protein [Gemmatimonadota bacterium]